MYIDIIYISYYIYYYINMTKSHWLYNLLYICTKKMFFLLETLV